MNLLWLTHIYFKISLIDYNESLNRLCWMNCIIIGRVVIHVYHVLSKYSVELKGIAYASLTVYVFSYSYFQVWHVSPNCWCQCSVHALCYALSLKLKQLFHPKTLYLLSPITCECVKIFQHNEHPTGKQNAETDSLFCCGFALMVVCFVSVVMRSLWYIKTVLTMHIIEQYVLNTLKTIERNTVLISTLLSKTKPYSHP